VDGREVPIEFFNEVADGKLVSGPGPANTAGSPAQEPEVVGRSVLLYIDDTFGIASQRNTVLDQIAASLSQLSPQDEVAIAAFDGKELKLLLDWTSDARDISEGLDIAKARKPDGLTTRVHQEQDFPDLGARLASAINAAAAAMRGVTEPEGRKVMLMLVGGWPLIDIPASHNFSRRRPTPINEGEEVFRPLIDTANLLGYTLYPVDVPGMSSGTGADARAEAPMNLPITSNEEGANDYALNFMAKATGGKAAINSARLEALPRMAEDTGTYYWLGFTPAWKADNQQHRIELKPRQRGLQVRTRSGFTDVDCEAQVFVGEDGTLSSTPCFTH
jgi:VWFA-related protein